jgi:hypothetical protein
MVGRDVYDQAGVQASDNSFEAVDKGLSSRFTVSRRSKPRRLEDFEALILEEWAVTVLNLDLTDLQEHRKVGRIDVF